MPGRWPKVCRWHRHTWPLYARYLARGTDPIFVGPFRGEVGYEALYWMPWVRAFAVKYKIAPERLIPITRGGAAEWYGVPMGLELLSMRSEQTLRVQNRLDQQVYGWQKQFAFTAFDQGIVKDAAHTLKIPRFKTLHPGWMYGDLEPFITVQAGLHSLNGKLGFDVLPPPALPDGLKLPEQFVAVRYYSRPSFPVNPLTTSFARESIAKLAHTYPVILLNHSAKSDDHVDFRPKDLPANVQVLSDMTTILPERSLAITSAVMARAIGFVGTYGGLAHLALRFNRPTFCFYQELVATTVANKHLSEHLAKHQGIPFMALPIQPLVHLQQIVPTLTMQVQGPTLSSAASRQALAAP